ncbi:MAG TPA: hypothetical protein VIE89_17670 [Candidatus Binatia bacterium]|jgi:hypothetical protein
MEKTSSFSLYIAGSCGVRCLVVTWLLFVGYWLVREIPASAIYPGSGFAYRIELGSF